MERDDVRDEQTEPTATDATETASDDTRDEELIEEISIDGMCGVY